VDIKHIEEYYRVYNLSAEDAIDAYYTDDGVFEYAGVQFKGKELISKKLTEFHKTFSEKMIPLNILTSNGTFAAEIETRLQARFDIIFDGRTLKAGETIITKYGAFYDTRGNQIKHARIYKI